MNHLTIFRSDEDVHEAVRDLLLAEAGCDFTNVADDQTIKDLCLDSIDRISFLHELEQRLGILISAQELAGCRTVVELLQLAAGKRRAG
jgi:acyl carrier protein